MSGLKHWYTDCIVIFIYVKVIIILRNMPLEENTMYLEK